MKIDKQNLADILPLTDFQQTILYDYFSFGSKDQYFEQIQLLVGTELDAAFFKEAWQAVGMSFPTLRTVFRWQGISEPIQVFLKHKEIICRVYRESRHQRLSDILQHEREEGFDLTQTCFRAVLIQSEGKSHIIINYHHIICDGWSNGPLLCAFVAAYKRLLDCKPAFALEQPNYAKSFVVFLQKMINQERIYHYWSQYLSGYQRNALFTPGQVETELISVYEAEENPMSEQLLKFAAQKYAISLSTMFSAAWGVALYLYSGNPDHVFATITSGRDLLAEAIPGIHEAVGLFLDVLPQRTYLQADMTYMQLLECVQHESAQRMQHGYIPADTLRQVLQADAGSERFDTMVVVENYPTPVDVLSCTEIPILNYDYYQEKTSYHITVCINMLERMTIRFIYRENTVGQENIRSLAQIFLDVLHDMVSDPDKLIFSKMNTKTSELGDFLFCFD